jgi:glycerol-3-phosphate dehydrogenase (NAD(P)+)
MEAAVVGAGSWGTALAIQLARAGHAVTLWGRDAASAKEMAETRENKRYLPGAYLPAPLTPTSDLEQAVRAGSRLLVCAVPSHAVRETMTRAAACMCGETVVVSATKGLEEGSSKRMREVLEECTPCRGRLAVLA